MILKSWTALSLTFVFAGIFTACTGSDNDGAASKTPSQSYAEATTILEAQGVQLVSDDTETQIVERFDYKDYNAQLEKLKTNDESLAHSKATVAAMENFVEKANALLEEGTLTVNELKRVRLKRNLIVKNLPIFRNQMDAFGLIEIAEALEKDAQKEKPFFVELKDKKTHLCGTQPLKSTDLAHKLSVPALAELKVIKLLLCSDPELLEKAHSKFRAYPADKEMGHAYTSTRFEAPSDLDEGRLQIPKDRESLKNVALVSPSETGFNSRRSEIEWLEDEEGHEEGHDGRPINGSMIPVAIKMPIFELIYLLENNSESQDDLSFFVSNFALNGRADQNHLEYFSKFYAQKEAILGKFKNPALIERLDALFERSVIRSTDEVIRFVVDKNYESLERFATAKNSNKTSRNKRLRITNNLYHFGFSPLMVAAILDDQRAITILLDVEGIDPNLVSDVFKKSYRAIRSTSRSDLRHQQYYSGGGSGGGFGGGGSGGASGGSSGGGSSSSSGSSSHSDRYAAYTALMMTIKDKNCEAAEVIYSQEPETLNFKTPRGETALSVSLSSSGEPCLKFLLNAGAYNLGFFVDGDEFGQYIARSNLPPIEFLKHVPGEVFQQTKVQERVLKALVFSSIPFDFKVLLHQRVPITKKQFVSQLSDEDLGHHSCFAGQGVWPLMNVCFDLKFANHLKVDLATAKAFGPEKDILLNYVLSHLATPDRQTRKPRDPAPLIERLNAVNSKWITDWANQPSSFKGHNPLVAASMFGKQSLVSALLNVEGLDPNVPDEKSGYNALEWQYISNPNRLGFARSDEAKKLNAAGLKVRRPQFQNQKYIEFSIGLDRKVKSEMEDVLEATPDPFSGVKR